MLLIGAENSVWRNLRGGLLLLALSPFIILIAAIALILKPFARPLEMTPGQAVESLRGIVDGTAGEWALDDFTSIRVADPRLEHIRERAVRIPEPLDESGLLVLRELLSEAEALAAGAV